MERWIDKMLNSRALLVTLSCLMLMGLVIGGMVLGINWQYWFGSNTEFSERGQSPTAITMQEQVSSPQDS